MDEIQKLELKAAFKGMGLAVTAAASVMSLVAGALVGAAIATRRLRAEYEGQIEKELEAARHIYARQYKSGEFATPEAAAAKLIPTPEPKVEIKVADPELAAAMEALRDYRGGGSGHPALAVTEEIKEVTHNVFTDAPYIIDEFDWEAEIEKRDPDKPYIINEYEYMEAETSYPQVTLTYFAGDKVLADEKGREIPDEELEELIGSRSLTLFGQGCKDENTVFVRNNSQSIDLEVVRSDGYYTVEVMGLEAPEPEELRHSYSRPRKFREDDD